MSRKFAIYNALQPLNQPNGGGDSDTRFEQALDAIRSGEDYNANLSREGAREVPGPSENFNEIVDFHRAEYDSEGDSSEGMHPTMFIIVDAGDVQSNGVLMVNIDARSGQHDEQREELEASPGGERHLRTEFLRSEYVECVGALAAIDVGVSDWDERMHIATCPLQLNGQVALYSTTKPPAMSDDVDRDRDLYKSYWSLFERFYKALNGVKELRWRLSNVWVDEDGQTGNGRNKDHLLVGNMEDLERLHLDTVRMDRTLDPRWFVVWDRELWNMQRGNVVVIDLERDPNTGSRRREMEVEHAANLIVQSLVA